MAKKIKKALIGALATFAGALGTAYSDEVITGEEWAAIASATVVAGLSVFTVKNAEWKPQDKSVESR